MLIRQETEADYAAIYDLVKTAFLTAKVSSGDEQNFVDRLRAGGNYIPDLALIAEEEGAIVGHVMLTRMEVETEAGPYKVLLLAPLAVALAHRRKGIGAALVEEVFARARGLGHEAAMLVGDPAYYARFGFRGSADFGIRNRNGIPEAFVMALELVPGALGGKRGRVMFET